MKTQLLLIPLWLPIAIAAVPAHADPVSVGPGNGTMIPAEGRECGELLLNSDQTYENGYAWSGGFVSPPEYGAFAECYSGVQTVCSVVFDFTRIEPSENDMDAFLWEDASGEPGTVLAVARFAPGPIAFWPSVSRHSFPLAFECTPDMWWVGYWGNWPGVDAGWFVGADLDGFGGCPRTKLPVNELYPSGWFDVSLVWGPTQAVGIGAEVVTCATPTFDSSWGAIKSLYE